MAFYFPLVFWTSFPNWVCILIHAQHKPILILLFAEDWDTKKEKHNSKAMDYTKHRFQGKGAVAFFFPYLPQACA